MHTLIQLSDLHFGTHDQYITEELIKEVKKLKADSLAVSGDLTMRATHEQFEEAAAFLKKFTVPTIVVPGNHDISLYNLFRRFYKPLHRFRSYIAAQEESHFSMAGLTVIGLNSSRSLTIKGGDISSGQVRKVEEILAGVPKGNVKVVVTHHPINEISKTKLHKFIEAGVDVFLSGHSHRSGRDLVTRKLKDREHVALMIEAGTSTSKRYRNEHNSFNRLIFSGKKLTLETYTWQESEMAFTRVLVQEYEHAANGWSAA